MMDISTIKNPKLLIMNDHLNLYKISFDDNSIKKFIDEIKNNWCINYVTTVTSSQEINSNQIELLKSIFPNLQYFNIES
jgi:hypothetical protein